MRKTEENILGELAERFIKQKPKPKTKHSIFNILDMYPGHSTRVHPSKIGGRKSKHRRKKRANKKTIKRRR